MTQEHRPLLLVILDGFGYSETPEHNAIVQANTPHWDAFWQHYPHTLISGSGHDVGLPPGQMGNSEVGHLNIGAGRLVPQELARINGEITSGAFETNPVLLDACEKAKNNQHALHIIGLLSPGGVHSHEDQILAMLAMAKKHGVKQLYLHAILDGRDTPPKSALASLKKITATGDVKIASIIGRYYAMDRDKRWERVESAYGLYTEGKADIHANTAEEGLSLAYARGETDEFVKATAIHPDNTPPVTINDNDAIIFMNFRADRARQLTQAFIDPEFGGFVRQKQPDLSDYVTLTEYRKDFPVHVAYTPMVLNNILGEVVANAGLKQLRIAETEKYAHVTFFFNGGVETPFPGEERVLIPSPKVATYDLQPEMNANIVTDRLVEAIESQRFDMIICNYANPDMVGHTGNMDAAIKAIETIDTCLGRLHKALQLVGGEMMITADHGNAECMYNDTTQQAHTAHTSEPVPFVYIGRPATIINKDGVLADIAPTMLQVMGLPKPLEMTGKSLIELKK